MKKADAWVILRLDGDAVGFQDYVAVKGVYDSEFAAQSDVPMLSDWSKYVVLRTRHYLEDSKAEVINNKHPEKVQGFKINPLNTHKNNSALRNQLRIVRDLWNQLPESNRRKTILPLLSQLTELAVARATGASVIDNSHLAADLRLPDGKLVEVKTVLLDSERRKSPNLQLRSDVGFDFLALVIFDPNLDIQAARMIPVEALELYARPVSQASGHSLINLRVTQPFLDYPGSKNINFDKYILNAG